MAGVARRLQGVPYRVIDDPSLIYQFINTNVRLEWESDVRDAGGSSRTTLGCRLFLGGGGLWKSSDFKKSVRIPLW